MPAGVGRLPSHLRSHSRGRLNFKVLQIDPEATDEEIKKRFRQVTALPIFFVC